MFNFNFFKSKQKAVELDKPVKSAGVWRLMTFDGERNLGELGVAKKYNVDYNTLRLRSWQSYLDSEITQIVIKKYLKWIVGSGLQLQCEPAVEYLQNKKIQIDSEKFNKSVESSWKIYANSKRTSYSGMLNLHQLGYEAYKNSILGGDVLTILRLEKGNLTVQLVDGSHVQSQYGLELTTLENGNTVRNGIELDSKGTHIAYYVAVFNNNDFKTEYKRIPARNSQGIQMAFMTYGLKYRLDNYRGIPLIAIILESLAKMERYKSATLGSAEERQKIAYSIEHTRDSTGESPLLNQFAKVSNVTANDNSPVTSDGVQLEKKVAATTNKQTINMPIGSSLKSLESKNELFFGEFFSVNIGIICATLGIPPEVAMSKYDSNFSASRAALKDWEHTIMTDRDSFSTDWYKNIYNVWLRLMIFSNELQVDGYLNAVVEDNLNVVEAFEMCRFVGASVPHIDPLKEVNAERAKLGELGKNIPLTTVENATRNLNSGDSDQNIKQFAKEYDEAIKLKLIKENESVISV